MKSYAAHLRSVLAQAPKPKSERLPAAEAAGRTLLADVVARVDDPAEARSAMDGYAVYSRDLKGALKTRPVWLPESGVLAAGRDRARALRYGQVRRIMTGAALPPG